MNQEQKLDIETYIGRLESRVKAQIIEIDFNRLDPYAVCTECGAEEPVYTGNMIIHKPDCILYRGGG